MTAKMNWDRIRKESLSRRSGVEWIGTDGTQPGIKNKEDKPPMVAASGKSFFAPIIIPGCTCKKPVGFKGAHKKSCPCNWKRKAGNDTNSQPSLDSFAETVGKADSRKLLANFLVSLQGELDSNRDVPEYDRKAAQSLLQLLRRKLVRQGTAKPHTNSRSTESQTLRILTELLQMRMPVYLRSDGSAASRALESAARKLSLELIRFPCSHLTRENALSGVSEDGQGYHPTALSKAYANGGLFCFEGVEKAPPDFQLWLEAWLKDSPFLGFGSTAERHADFVIVLTSPVPLRELWSGRVDAAFIDVLRYVNMPKAGWPRFCF